MNDKIRSLIRKRQAAFKKGNDLLWKFLRNCVNRAIIQAKLTFTDRKLSQMDAAEPRAWFTTIKQIAGMQNKTNSISIPGLEQATSDQLANIMNDHFGNICSSLPVLDTSQLPAYLPAPAAPPTVTRSQVWKELSRIKVHKAPGPDRIPNRVIRLFAFEISKPLTNIINASILEGVVPTQWKQAIVVPVPKVNPTPSLDKLRPVSLTPTLAKVAETFVAKWMMEDMTPKLDPRQYGNRKGCSATHYLVQLVQYAHQAVEDGYNADLLAIDYSKAFDRVDITVAMQKLLKMGVRRELLPWIGSFLSNRQQCVRANGAMSDWMTITCGVPQGTKVGPVVFLAMVNDVADEHLDR